ncbi:MAG TPA: WGR domain-containing protein [Bradyrhizobium sp.]|nr:WGR domain-containing protein [Bradyrhizobium sp.]
MRNAVARGLSGHRAGWCRWTQSRRDNYRIFRQAAQGRPPDRLERFYKLDVQPNLFGQWSFVREWGRIGRGGTVRTEGYATRSLADVALIAAWARKRSRGYV